MLSDHGETTEGDVVVDESSEESTGSMPPLPLVSRFGDKGFKARGHDCRDGEESSVFDCWDWRHEQFDISQHATLGHRMNRSLCPARRVASQ